MPIRSKETKKIVSLQQSVREKFTDPLVIARLLPNTCETAKIFLEFQGPCVLNFIVDCEDESDRFVQLQMAVVCPDTDKDGAEEEEEESEDSFKLE